MTVLNHVFAGEESKLFSSFVSKELKGNRAIGNLKLGVTKDEYGKTVCELEYYHKKEYKTAWFDDNVGSLLIVIEKESH